SNISIDEQVEVSQFNTGTYFVKITSGNAVKTSKFIKL
ncbi:MAG: T9SS type A sorting domain-containing protein, partial [Lutibacter sp.]|nr:T9SS type A sorting domain-containing protein [Lutibacter sp.]